MREHGEDVPGEACSKNKGHPGQYGQLVVALSHALKGWGFDSHS